MRLAIAGFNEINQADVDVLAATRLMTVHGDDVLSGPEYAGGILGQGNKVVGRGEPLELADEPAVDVHLGVFVVVDEELRRTERFRIKLERSPEPDVAGLPLGVNDRARSRSRAEAALAGGPRRSRRTRVWSSPGPVT